MAGSYNHVVKDDGSLAKPDRVLGMLEARGSGDVYEAIEEMYGMIWWLGREAARSQGLSHEAAEAEATRLIEEARQNYKEGLYDSPTKRFKRPEMR